MVITQGEIWWADLGEPTGSEPGYSRPVLVVQCDRFNQSRIATVVCVVLTKNQKFADAPGNVLLLAGQTGLDCDSVANVSQMVTIDKHELRDCTGQISQSQVERVLSGIGQLLGR
jgi:mRNA interferase MazF